MTTLSAPSSDTTSRAGLLPPPVRRKPDLRWVLTALAFPPAGYLGHLIGGPVDSPAAAAVGGLITGAAIGVAQWTVLRRLGIGAGWIVATALGLATGLAAGATIVSYETGLEALVVMGAVSGLGVGMAQARLLHGTSRKVAWSLLTASVWSLGWTVSTVIGVTVEEQFIVFGISGALAGAAVQSSVVRSFAKPQATS